MPNANAATISSGGTQSWYAREFLGQTFTVPVGNNITITNIFIPGVFFRNGTGCINAKLYSSVSKTSLLDTSTTNICDTDASTERTGTAGTGSLTFSGGISLTAGSLYYFELYSVTAGQAFWTNQTYPGTYSGGDLTANGTIQSGFDNAFTITYNEIIAVPVIRSVAANNSPTFGTPTLLTADVDSDSKVTFLVNGKRIPGCIGLRPGGSGSSFTANCNWKPKVKGVLTVTAVASSIALNSIQSNKVNLTLFVQKRTSFR